MFRRCGGVRHVSKMKQSIGKIETTTSRIQGQLTVTQENEHTCRTKNAIGHLPPNSPWVRFIMLFHAPCELVSGDVRALMETEKEPGLNPVRIPQ